MATAGVSIRMVRNFGILKILLFRPTRSEQYSTGPGDVTLTKNATIKAGMPKQSKAAQEQMISKKRFNAGMAELGNFLGPDRWRRLN